MSDKKSYVIASNIYSIEAKKGIPFTFGSTTINNATGETQKFNADMNKKLDEFETAMRLISEERLIKRRRHFRHRIAHKRVVESLLTDKT